MRRRRDRPPPSPTRWRFPGGAGVRSAGVPRTGRPARGYGATSIQDLVDALGVERGSLYGTFGDKRRFYLEAVRLYWEVYERHLTAALDTGPLLPALREILTHPVRLDELISDMGVPQGCLVGNTTAELVPQDGDATEVVTRSYRRFTDIVAGALRRAQAAGEVTDTSSPEAQAQLLLYIVQGLSLVSRAGLDRTAALAAIDTALDGLRA
ncbi:TetR/AcrR family transcriptional regulator [Streptomyces lavenduligriseus]|nr:TetR/AcrR family transcriptional regulator [Streptomyces lavenduligriseus]